MHPRRGPWRVGNLNYRFAQMAKNPLTRAFGGGPGTTKRAKNLASWLPRAMADAERRIGEQWASGGYGKSESLPRQRVAQFSQWFANFEPPLAAGGGGGSSGGGASASMAFRLGIEVPGQYDFLVVPPDPASHATVVGFEPEAGSMSHPPPGP